MPTGSALGEQGAGDQVGADDEHAPSSARGQQRRAGAAGQPDGDLRDDERDERDRPGRGDRDGDAADRDQHRGRLRPRQPHAEPAGGVVAELEHAEHPARRPAPAGSSTASATASGTACSQVRALSEPVIQT